MLVRKRVARIRIVMLYNGKPVETFVTLLLRNNNYGVIGRQGRLVLSLTTKSSILKYILQHKENVSKKIQDRLILMVK